MNPPRPSRWKELFAIAIAINGTVVERWTLGGGTAPMPICLSGRSKRRSTSCERS
jgi:hypothetical protein